ncbi:DNA-binding response regulator [Amorphoplanes nipponensis]|uniref:DNA-binding response regulator n=1 Tax=Actinoplanes nipponensis TaxID=135950 RepID=A0A919JEB0_9ACTN|nr:response regulator transcription factor [Actinoplanes nipponensis]GIE47412.1 DNA-binding response regulator [Actinoplanes nipponensis]
MRVIVAEDSVIMREGLCRLLEDAGITVAGRAGDAPTLLAQVERGEPDVVLTDIRMPPTHTDEGLRAAREIRDRHPGVGVLILSQYLETTTALRALSRHPRGLGYLLKERIADVGQLIEAIGRVAAGGSVIDPQVVATLLGRRRTAGALDELTARERTVLGLMAEGRSNDAIAQRLGVGGKTVETYVRNIFMKLCLEQNLVDHRRVLAVLAYLGQ